MAQSKPPGLVALGIIGLVAGLLLTCSGTFGAVAVLFQEATQAKQREFMVGLPGQSQSPETLEAFDHMAAQTQELAKTWMPALVTIYVLHVLLALALLFGSALALGLRPLGRGLLIWGTAIAIPFEVLRSGVESLYQVELQEIMAHYMVETMAVAGGGPGGTEGFMTMATVLGLAMGGLWALLKIAFFVVVLVYMRRAPIRALFAPATTAF